MSDSKSGRTTAILSYITIIGCLIAITRNMEPKNAFARFHTRQAFGIHLIYHSVATFLNLSKIDTGWVFLWSLYAIGILFCLFGAIKNKQQFLPLLGTHFQKWFTFIP